MRALQTALVAITVAGAAMAPARGPSAQTAMLATPWTELHASRVRLVASRTRTADGLVLAGLEIAMAEGWKTYWRMPGDSGVPPSFDWAGSSNVGTTKVLYPAPTRMPEAGGEAIGYKRAVLFPIEMAPQDRTKPVVVKLALEFGVCREICIPATANIEFAIPPGPAGAPPAEIAAAIARVPRPQASRRKTDPKLESVAVSREGSSKLTIAASFAGDAKGADVFIEAPEGLYVPMAKRVEAATGGVVRFETNIGHDLAQDLKGKTLTLTLVSASGASEAQWTFP